MHYALAHIKLIVAPNVEIFQGREARDIYHSRSSGDVDTGFRFQALRRRGEKVQRSMSDDNLNCVAKEAMYEVVKAGRPIDR